MISIYSNDENLSVFKFPPKILIFDCNIHNSRILKRICNNRSL